MDGFRESALGGELELPRFLGRKTSSVLDGRGPAEEREGAGFSSLKADLDGALPIGDSRSGGVVDVGDGGSSLLTATTAATLSLGFSSSGLWSAIHCLSLSLSMFFQVSSSRSLAVRFEGTPVSPVSRSC